jgi:hypothetical protein
MRGKKIFGIVAIVTVGILSITAPRTSHGSPAEQEQNARCKVVVPKDWGEYIGAGSYGLEFKDDAGTIRFVKQFPCGLEGAPNVSLEVHRN